MSTTLAISGKGGSGKTTLAALAVRHLVGQGARGILAVDADPNACLGAALGLEPPTTVADIRDATLDRTLQPGPGADRERAFEYAVHQAVAEGRGFDLLAMGHPEGPKCYCAVNHLLRKYLDAASQDYRYLVLDCEAGMEHLSRRTTDAVDCLLVVAEPTVLGATTARRILGLAGRLPIRVGRTAVLWNKVRDASRLAALGADLPVLGAVPFDPAVLEASMGGRTVWDLAADGPAAAAVAGALADLLGAPAAPRKP